MNSVTSEDGPPSDCDEPPPTVWGMLRTFRHSHHVACRSTHLIAGKQMYESDAIIQYLFSEYGDGEVPLTLRMGYFTTLTAGLALAPRWVAGGWGGGVGRVEGGRGLDQGHHGNGFAQKGLNPLCGRLGSAGLLQLRTSLSQIRTSVKQGPHY
jgi:hypothetical protein